MQSHAYTLISLIVTGAFCEDCPLPWGCERIDEFSGPGTAHVWLLFDAEDAPLEHLPADVDGPAFVAWVNAQGSALTQPDEPATSRKVERVIVVEPVGEDLEHVSEVEDYLADRLFAAGVWHVVWVDDLTRAAERVQEMGEGVSVAVITVRAEDVSGDAVTHVREDGKRVPLSTWLASINPGARAGAEVDDVTR